MPLQLKKGNKVRRGEGLYGAQGGKYGTDAPRRVISLLRLACLIHYALQLILLVLWQLIIPVGERLFEVVLQGVLLVCGKLFVPRQ